MTTPIIPALLALGLLALAFAYRRLARRVEQVLREARDYAAEVSLPAAQSASKAREEAGRVRNGLEVFKIGFESRMADLKATAAKCSEHVGELAIVAETLRATIDAEGAMRRNAIGGLEQTIAELDATGVVVVRRVDGLVDSLAEVDRQASERINKTARMLAATDSLRHSDHKAICSRLDDLDSRVSALEAPKTRKAKESIFSPRKGGQNPPNTTSARPPKPGGSEPKAKEASE